MHSIFEHVTYVIMLLGNVSCQCIVIIIMQHSAKVLLTYLSVLEPDIEGQI